MTGEIGKLSADQEEQGDRFALLTGLLPAAIWNVKLSLTDLFFFQAEDGIRDYKVTGVQTLCSSDLLPVAAKPESQEICFVPSGNYVQFIEAYLGEQGSALPADSGEVVSTSGEVLGHHDGVHKFTVG